MIETISIFLIGLGALLVSLASTLRHGMARRHHSRVDRRRCRGLAVPTEPARTPPPERQPDHACEATGASDRRMNQTGEEATTNEDQDEDKTALVIGTLAALGLMSPALRGRARADERARDGPARQESPSCNREGGLGEQDGAHAHAPDVRWRHDAADRGRGAHLQARYLEEGGAGERRATRTARGRGSPPRSSRPEPGSASRPLHARRVL